ncbi:hypothetical protein CBS63078_4247 [Aspergillus niger]|uniref:Endoribonuclease L-PSP family protein n=1 Tax=Aspergillus niger TaxID=5061 RepID=A0A505IBA7_ASPNG|nr:hypothetical protein CBS115989_9727 [Aspergillus niger]KAI2825470.1 hypothetical protein CBS133816_8491 [Aspergillus niger]KAI2849827.1 hypothetical protein CBS11232_6483 [Aspergillus niger]KAI2849923.1 hypothetical protein CBS11350_1836 [Aspergillus niger]KAI2851629.1 hypothetical protein CBS12448_8419 [Aspergillus niger]
MRLLWVLLAWLAFAVSADPFVNEAHTVVKRDDIGTKCGIARVLTSNSKRSVGYIRLERNGTNATAAGAAMPLSKRMTLPGPSLGIFYKDEMPKRTRELELKNSYRTAASTSAAIMHRLGRTRNTNQFSTGVEGLHGCTTMYIISRKAVYITHWWENVAFAADEIDEKGNPGWREGRTDEELLEISVLNLLRKGGKQHAKLDANIIEDEHIRAYLIRPSKAYRQLKDPSADDYTYQWNKIRTTVGELVPTLQDQSRWTDIPYVRVRNVRHLDEEDTVRGRNLFKFDQAHDIGGGQTQTWAMMWAEDELYHEDKW